MNFTGGPWLLRNGITINKINKLFDLYIPHEDDRIKLPKNDNGSLEWDNEGNASIGGEYTPEYDIMENLDNYKYNRSVNNE